MGNLIKPYKILIWDNEADEEVCVIGSNEIDSQSRAINPKLVENVNGTHTLTFSMYYQYKDNMTGEKVINPFVK